MAAGKPVNPSTQAMKMSLTPRFGCWYLVGGNSWYGSQPNVCNYL